jgi:hypothetical protein
MSTASGSRILLALALGVTLAGLGPGPVPEARAGSVTVSDPADLYFEVVPEHAGIEWAIRSYCCPARLVVEDWQQDLGGDVSQVMRLEPSPDNFNSLIVEDDGDIRLANGVVFIDRGSRRLGVGTTVPAELLHVSDIDTPTIRLQQTATIFPAQSWELRANELNFMLRDVTGNTSPFQVEAEAPGASLVIDTTGRIGLGTSTPQGNIHVNGLATQDLFSGMGPDLASGPAFNFGYSGSSFGRGSGFFNVRPDAAAAAPNPSLRFATANVQRMIITSTGNVGIGTLAPSHPLQLGSGAHVTAGGVWTNASSREGKTDVEALTTAEALAALAGLTPVKYAVKADLAERHLGFIAEDVPDLVARPDRTSLSPMDLVALLTRVVQAQQQAIAEMAAELAALRRAGR